MTGIEVFLEILASAEIPCLFGNPGSTELPLNDALAADPRFQYYLGLHEVPVMGMADGFAMASGKVGVVNVHSCCGLGNAMGMLYNAFIGGTPLLLTAGQQDRRLRIEEPVLEGDLVQVARPWTKWAHEVARPEDMATAVRRAVQTAMTPPTGPVFLSLPVDVQMEDVSGADVSPPSIPDRRIRPPADALANAARLLVDARRLVILAGSRVTECGGEKQLADLAERLGAPVFDESATSHGRLPMATGHPLYSGSLPLWSPDVRARLAPFDAILVVGMNLLREYIHHVPTRPLPDGVRIVHLDSNPWEIGKNFPIDVGLIGDPAEGLRDLGTIVSQLMTEDQAAAASDRVREIAAQREAAREALADSVAAQQARRPMTSLAFMHAVGTALPANAAVVQEAVTTHSNYLEAAGMIETPQCFFAQRGWALGWGLGCALGVKIAWPERPVVALLGDGAAMYGIQGLWTAARYRLPVCFVVANNSQYKILKNCGQVMHLPQMVQGNHVGMDLTNPSIDFVDLANSLGVRAERISDPDALSDAVRGSLAGDQPVLFDVAIDGS